jgi:hypothetical protein
MHTIIRSTLIVSKEHFKLIDITTPHHDVANIALQNIFTRSPGSMYPHPHDQYYPQRSKRPVPFHNTKCQTHGYRIPIITVGMLQIVAKYYYHIDFLKMDGVI